MTDPAGIPALIDAIRHLHDCGAKHVETVHVHEKTPDGSETVWEGDVEVFELDAHPEATRCYAWTEATHGGKRRFFAVLHLPPVDSPAYAVRASIYADVQNLKKAQQALS
jgi:hypothetical protein